MPGTRIAKSKVSNIKSSFNARMSQICLPPKKTRKAAAFVAGGEPVLGDDLEAEPVGFEEVAGQILLKAVTEFETAEQISFAVAFAVHIMSTPQVSPTIGSLQ